MYEMQVFDNQHNELLYTECVHTEDAEGYLAAAGKLGYCVEWIRMQ